MRTAYGLAAETINRSSPFISGMVTNRGRYSTITGSHKQATAANNGNPEVINASNSANPTITFEGQTYEVKANVPYKRPNNATTVEQRVAVNQIGARCATCGTDQGPFIADHKNVLVIEHISTGTIDKKKMRSLNAVQSQCAGCSLD